MYVTLHTILFIYKNKNKCLSCLISEASNYTTDVGKSCLTQIFCDYKINIETDTK